MRALGAVWMLVSTANNAPEIAVTGTATINITGKVDASVAGNDLDLAALNGAITIGGAVGSATTAMGDLIANGNTTFTAKGAVTVEQLGLANFGTSISFAEAVKVGGTLGANVNAAGTGTISFAKTIEATSAAGVIGLSSVNGSLTVTGNITGKDTVQISSTSGAISVAGITTDQAGADITIISDTGNITTNGAISTSGATTSSDDAGIEIDTQISGNITIGGNVSTSGGGDILLGADIGFTASGTGNLTINGTVSTTGTTESGDVVIGTGGTGTVTVNKALSTGAATTPGDIGLVAVNGQTNAINVSRDVTINSADGVAFLTTGSTNTISLANGANVTAVIGVIDTGSGNLNSASNITVSNASSGINGIELNDLSINLTGAVSLKSSATSASNGVINVASVNGAQNLTLEATGAITLASVGQTTALNTVTVTNSAGVTSSSLSAASVVLSDTTGNISFGGNTVISKSLTTAAKAYGVSFSGTSVIAGAPVFLNTGATSFAGNTSLSTGNATSTASLAGTIVSGGAFNIGAIGSTTINTSVNPDTVQLILNSTSATSTFASKVTAASADNMVLLGVGTLTLSGDSSADYLGSFNVTNGTLNVTGKIGGATTTSLTSGTISGAGGTIGALNTTIGNVAPGGTLKTGAVTLGAATKYNIAVVSSTVTNNVDVTGAGIGGGPNVKVFQVDEISGAVSLQTNFFAFNAPSFTGGVYVAVGDTNNDGFSDVIVGAGATGGSRVQVYAGSANGLVTGSTLNDFFAYSPAFTGGVVVAAGFRDGIAGQDVVTAPASNGGYNIRSFNCNGTGNTPTLVDNFFAFNNTTAVGGLSLALQDLDGTPVDDIIIGSTNSQFGVVLNQTGSSNPNTITASPFPGFTGAIRAGVAQDANFNYAVAAAGPGGGPVTTVYQVINGGLSQTDSLFVLNPQFTGGLFVSS